MIATRHTFHISSILYFIASSSFIILENVGKNPILPDGVFYVILAIITLYFCIRYSLLKEGIRTQMVIDGKNVRIIHVGIENKKRILHLIDGVKSQIESNLEAEPQLKRMYLAQVTSLYDNVSSIAPNLLEEGMPLYNLLNEIGKEIQSYNGNFCENVQEFLKLFDSYNNKINCLIK